MNLDPLFSVKDLAEKFEAVDAEFKKLKSIPKPKK